MSPHLTFTREYSNYWAFSSSLEPAVASFSDPDQMVKNKAHTRELARNPKLITSGLLQDPPVWLDGWVWSWWQLIWEVADPSFLPTPPVLGGGAIGGPYMIYNTTGFSGVELPNFESRAGKKTFDANQFKTRQ